MTIQYKDYYKLLGVARAATKDQIKKAYRDLAKKYHPDRNPGDEKAETRFKEITEAYEVLGDEARRKQYDLLGPGWKEGQDFRPPPGWEDMAGAGGAGGGGRTFRFSTGGGGGSGFSNFFDFLKDFAEGSGHTRTGGGVRMEDILGAAGAGYGRPGAGFGATSPFEEPFGAAGSTAPPAENEISITLEEAFAGASRNVVVAIPETSGGRTVLQRREYRVKVPAGIRDGQKIRLKTGGPAGDIQIRVRVEPHSHYSLEGADLNCEVRISPWEAALGGRITVQTLDGPAEVNLPAGISSGKKLRIKGRGFPTREGDARGDLMLRVMIHVPKSPTAQEKELFEKLQRVSRFNPRDGAS